MPEKLPIEVIRREFNDSAGGTIARLPMAAYTAGDRWGQTGSTDVVGLDEKTLTGQLYIKYLSLTERKAGLNGQMSQKVKMFRRYRLINS